jgi:hypothetical protein
VCGQHDRHGIAGTWRLGLGLHVEVAAARLVGKVQCRPVIRNTVL